MKNIALFLALLSVPYAILADTFEPHYGSHQKSHQGNWVTASYGRVPQHAVIGGYSNEGKPFIICRAKYLETIQPGKIVGENCNFSYQGAEIITPIYQVLISKSGFKWAAGNDAFVPKDAVSGGYQAKRHLFICQGKFDGGIYPGKIINNRCLISHAGGEESLEFYNVLVG